MKKQNHYYKTRKRLTKRSAPSLNALKLFLQGVLAGVGMPRHMVAPVPKFPKGGISNNEPAIVGESGSEMILDKEGIMKHYKVPVTLLGPGNAIKFDPAKIKDAVENSRMSYDIKQILTGGIQSKS